MDRPTSLVTRNATALLGGRAVAAIVGLLTVPAIYGHLGPRRFGLWALLLGAVAVAGLVDFGLYSAQVREVALACGGREPGRACALLAVGMIGMTLLASLFAALAWLGWPVLTRVFDLGALADEGRTAMLLLLASLAVEAIASPWRAALEGTQHLRSVAVITAATAMVAGVGGVALVTAGHGVRGLGWSTLAGSVLRLWLFLAAARRRVPAMRPRVRAIDRDVLGTVSGYGWRVQVSNGAAVINNDTDRLVLGAFSSPSAVAPFDLGSRMANVLRLVPTYVIIAIFPVAAAMHATGDRDSLDRLYLSTTRYLAAFAAVASAALIVGAAPLVVLWLGHPVPLAAATIALLAPGYAINLASGAASALSRAEGAPERETRYALLAAGLNVVTTLPLLWVFGPVGVPLSTTAAYVVATAYFFRHFHRVSGRPLRQVTEAIWKPFSSAAFAASVVWATLGRAPFPPGRLSAAIAAASRAGLVVLLSAGALAALGFFQVEDPIARRRFLPRFQTRSDAAALADATKGSP